DPKSILQNKNIDFVVPGEGEITTKELVDAIEQGGNVSEVKGIGYKLDSEVVFTPARPFIENLDVLPFPAWDLVDIERYFCFPTFNIFYSSRQYMSVFTSRGCPYNCIYCHKIFGKKFRARTPENIFQEIEILCKKFNIKEIQIVDDCFNLKPERAKKLCDMIIDSDLDIAISFPNGVRGDLMDEELLIKLKKAGTYKINYGIETGSQRLQKFIKKNVNLKNLQKVITLTNSHNILSHGFFILGFPTETREEVQQTIEFARKSKLNTAGFFALS
ncbi:unnamed protein product, partial [marine sediment metagenome]